MGFKDLLVKLGVLKSGANAGTYNNATERTEVMGSEETEGSDIAGDTTPTTEPQN